MYHHSKSVAVFLAVCLLFSAAQAFPAAMLSARAVEAPKGYTVLEKELDLQADYVSNQAGYASLLYTPTLEEAIEAGLNEKLQAELEDSNAHMPAENRFASVEDMLRVAYEADSLEDYYKNNAQMHAALADKTGRIIMPYLACAPQAEPEQSFYLVNDGVISKNNWNPGYLSVGAYETGRYGYFDLNGNRLFDIPYQFGKMFGDGIAFVRLCETVETEDGDTERTVHAYLIDKTGTPVLDLGKNFARYEGIGDGREGLSLINFAGSFGVYSEGLIGFSFAAKLETSVLNEKNGWDDARLAGYCDLNGNIVIEQQYYDCEPFHEGLAAVQEADIHTTYYYYEDGISQEEPIEGKTADNVRTKVTGGKFGFIDKTGKTVIPFEYDSAQRFYGDYAVVSKDGKYGVINQKNETVIPFEYDKIFSELENDIFLCLNDGVYELRTLSGETVFSVAQEKIDDISAFSGGVLYYVKDHKVTVVYAEKSRAPGDVDGNGKVTAADARLALRASVGLETLIQGTPSFLAADANGDGVIKAADARKILRAAVGLETL